MGPQHPVPNQITLPPRALVMLVGAAGSGKSSFAARHFRPSEIVSSDHCRECVSDDPANQRCNPQAFELFYTWLACRMQLGVRVVADATHTSEGARTRIYEIAKQHGYTVVPLLMSTTLEQAQAFNRLRLRVVPSDIIERHFRQLGSWTPNGTGYVVDSGATYDIVHSPGTIRTGMAGVDVIGDPHGCAYELEKLIGLLGYERKDDGYVHPSNRVLCVVGDWTDRGPFSAICLDILKALKSSGHESTMGNHDWKAYRKLKGNPVQVSIELAKTLEQLHESDTEWVRDLLGSLPFQATFRIPGAPDLVVCHAGMPRSMWHDDSKRAREHCIYGEVHGNLPDGRPNRGTSWIQSWKELDAVLVHGHTVGPWQHGEASPARVINVDGGCCFGMELRAFRWPEMELISVTAERTYSPLRETESVVD